MENWPLSLCRSYAVEAAVLLGALGQSLSAGAAKEFEWRQACRVDLAFDAELCAEIGYRGRVHHPEEYAAVDAAFTLAEIWREPVRSFVPAGLVLFAGAWSDRTGRRRAAIISPLVGEVVSSILLLATLAADTGLVTVALSRAIPGLFGDTTLLLVGALSHIGDWSDEDTRTRRVGRLTLAVLATNPLALLAARFIYSPGRYVALFAPSLLLAVSALILAAVFIKDKQPRPLPDNPVFDFFNPRSAVESFKVVFKKREGHTRIVICLLLLINICALGPGRGESTVLYQYLKRLKLDLQDVITLQLYSQIILLLGSFFAVNFLVKYFSIKDYILGILSGLNKLICNLCYAFANSLTDLYAITTMELFLSCNSIALRAMASKVVHPGELGKLYSVFGLMDLIFPSAFGVLYGIFFTATAETFTGSFFLLSLLFIVPIIIMYMVIHLISRKESQTECSLENKPGEQAGEACSETEETKI